MCKINQTIPKKMRLYYFNRIGDQFGRMLSGDELPSECVDIKYIVLWFVQKEWLCELWSEESKWPWPFLKQWRLRRNVTLHLLDESQTCQQQYVWNVGCLRLFTAITGQLRYKVLARPAQCPTQCWLAAGEQIHTCCPGSHCIAGGAALNPQTKQMTLTAQIKIIAVF